VNNYIIENVPYAWQEEGIYCSPATIEMIMEYYGFNTTQTEILYYIGGGYSLGYPFSFSKILSNHVKPPYTFKSGQDGLLPKVPMIKNFLQTSLV